MKKVQKIWTREVGMTKRPPHSENFAPVKVIKAKHRSASPCTDVTLSTYKKFRMVIPNFL